MQLYILGSTEMRTVGASMLLVIAQFFILKRNDICVQSKLKI